MRKRELTNRQVFFLKQRGRDGVCDTFTARKTAKAWHNCFWQRICWNFEYPRGQKAVITYTDDGHTETVSEGETKNALLYEVEDMEQTVAGNADLMHLDFTRDVMKIMTDIRKEWGMTYPEEE